MEIGIVLKECRRKASLSQEELASRIHVNQSDISKYESDVKEPPLSILNDWLKETQTQEIMIAFLLGADSASLMQQVIDMLPELSVISTILGGIL